MQMMNRPAVVPMVVPTDNPSVAPAPTDSNHTQVMAAIAALDERAKERHLEVMAAYEERAKERDREREERNDAVYGDRAAQSHGRRESSSPERSRLPGRVEVHDADDVRRGSTRFHDFF